MMLALYTGLISEQDFILSRSLSYEELCGKFS